ncbi:MAG: cation transporter, partial [Clostridia bacterium]|nr:cation transporter [Clostridia bacterium]
DIGIAIGAGTDVAIDTASVVLTKSSLMDAVRAIKLSRATFNNICQNLFWAFIYNSIAILVAVGVFTPLGFTLSPMIGALAMSLSSVSVVLNALRLNFFSDKYKYKRKSKVKFEELSTQVEEKGEKTMEFMLNVEGMQCSHCEASVERALNAMDGVKAVKADRTNNQVWVQASSDVDVNEIIRVIEDLGFAASV